MTDDATPAKVRLTDGLGPLVEDAAYDCLSDLAGVDTHNVNLRDHGEAWSAIEAFADAVRAAERKRCAQIVEAYRVPVGNSAAGEMAAEWTMDALREIRDAIRGA